MLFVQEENTQCNRAITLRESWFDSPCEKGSYIHLVGDFDSTGQCIVDNANNLIVLHPDHLLSATVVADSFTCSRRAVLQDHVKATGEATKPQVYGHILHDIFQEAMKANTWDLASLNGSIDRLLPKYVESLYDINVGMDEATEHLKSKMPALKAWAEAFLLVSPSVSKWDCSVCFFFLRLRLKRFHRQIRSWKTRMAPRRVCASTNSLRWRSIFGHQCTV